jgi:uncharacterized repeat protein (TIGR01451 family)
MNLWNLTAKASVATLLLAGAALMNACQSGGLEAYGRAPHGWVAPEGDDMGWSKPAPKSAPVAEKPAPAPAPAKPAPAPVMIGGDELCLPTGDRATSALCLRCSMPREVIAGTNFTYDIEVSNVSNIELQNVMVTYSLDGARIVSSDPTMTGGGFAIGNLGPKAARPSRSPPTPPAPARSAAAWAPPGTTACAAAPPWCSRPSRSSRASRLTTARPATPTPTRST